MPKKYKSTLYACYIGYFTQAIINNLAPLLFLTFQNMYDISFERIGRLALLNFVVQLIVDVICVKAIDRLGYRRSATIAHFFAALGLIFMGVLPGLLPNPYIGLQLAIITYAIGGGTLEVIVSPIVDALPTEDSSGAMSLLHSFYCWGQVAVILLSTLLLVVIGSTNWFILPIMWSVVPIANLFYFLKVPLLTKVAEGEQMSLRSLFSKRFFYVILLTMLCAGASEMSMSQWSSLFAEKGLGVTKVMGDLMGPCFFAILMGLGRTYFGIMGEKINTLKAMMWCSLLCVACYLTASLSTNPIISLLACALCGFSVSIMWPGTFHLASSHFPYGATAMFGLLAIFGDLGCSLSPWITGIVSDVTIASQKGLILANNMNVSIEQIGLKVGLLVAVLFPLLLFILILLTRLQKKRT